MLAWLAVVEGSGRFRRLAPVLVAVVLFSLGCAMRLPALLQQQAREDARHVELSQLQAASASQLAELERLKALTVIAEQRLQAAHWYLAAGESMSDLLERLAVSGHAHGLLVERLDVGEGEQQAGFSKVPLVVQVVGRYSALRLWLGDWLGQARILRSGDMSLATVDRQPGLLRLQLRVDAYHAATPLKAPAMLADLPARAAMVAPEVDPFAPAAARVASAGLVGVPLAQLEMVGSLARGAAREALLMAAGKLYRVRPGDRVERDQGVVMHIDQRQVEVRERLFMAGVWHERTAFITLAKRLGKEASDPNENVDEIPAGNPAVDPAGFGDALPG
ncbi:pilus assembly protein PilP [Pseudomonas putida]|uniref:pilus assembly protein PilP n=1 Tax=Pseudomonas putida TaxID=303 RepID=UPI000EF70DF2|nr:pilus assembly protein PilP [Pseudomonas putida]AYN13155.1 type IV pili biogenesis protein [Pseudomonas putida]